ncbi:hypothetical protein WA158_007912 [Blastocystis sp. Blastoise]
MFFGLIRRERYQFLFQDESREEVSLQFLNKYPECILSKIIKDENNKTEEGFYYADFQLNSLPNLVSFFSSIFRSSVFKLDMQEATYLYDDSIILNFPIPKQLRVHISSIYMTLFLSYMKEHNDELLNAKSHDKLKIGDYTETYCVYKSHRKLTLETCQSIHHFLFYLPFVHINTLCFNYETLDSSDLQLFFSIDISESFPYIQTITIYLSNEDTKTVISMNYNRRNTIIDRTISFLDEIIVEGLSDEILLNTIIDNDYCDTIEKLSFKKLSPDLCSSLYTILSHGYYKVLDSIQFYKTTFIQTDFNDFCQLLQQPSMRHIKHLILSANELKDNDCVSLSNVLRIHSFDSLQTLDISRNNISSLGLSCLFQSLLESRYDTIQSLQLEVCLFDLNCSHLFSRLIMNNQLNNLKELNLFQCINEIEAINIIMQSLCSSNINHLTSLNLSYNRFTNKHLDLLSTFILNNNIHSLQYLYFTNCELTKIDSLLTLFQNNYFNCLKELDLSLTTIDGISIKKLNNYILKNKQHLSMKKLISSFQVYVYC